MDRVYIIESPNQEDIEEDRIEGKALFEALTLANCDVIYSLIESKADFIEAMEFIIEDFFVQKGKWTSMPYIHISAHGDEDGIELTNGDLFDWSDFKIELEKINNKIGYVPHSTEYSDDVSRITLCFSACKGFNAFKIWDKINICPYQCVIGPIVDIGWSDSLTGFITFYHLTNYKGTGFAEAVNKMNISAGLDDEFQLYVSPEVGKKKSSC
ncbi:hypothetical protein [Nonlabens sp. Asnod2-A12]|uniref:hypothetical protein n=1 Tax=Nonlabens sp. Asnod2-A12 TaxID=3160578 RepID=UPI00386AF913